MGVTFIKATIKQLKNEKKSAEVKFLVDTGAQYTLVPRNVVVKLGLKPTKTQEFILADGKVVKRKLGEAYVQINGEKQPTTVILGEKGDSALLGTITLEQMGLIVDPFKRKLRPIKALLM